MQPGKTEETLLNQQLDDDTYQGFLEAIARRRHEGLPTFVAENGSVVDLQDKHDSERLS